MEGGQVERMVVELAEMARSRFYGKYRGIVEDVEDEENLGRIRVKVPEVYGDLVSPWALPCVPFAGVDHGVVWLPEAGDGVWVEFEAGDPSRPIWVGTWWGSDDLADDLANPAVRAFVTSAGHRIEIDDDNMTITIEHADGGYVEITDSAMTLECGSGKVELSSSGVKINDSALTVS
jgi:uncharacterized protein involved in type VI secretion and phage assembly